MFWMCCKVKLKYLKIFKIFITIVDSSSYPNLVVNQKMCKTAKESLGQFFKGILTG